MKKIYKIIIVIAIIVFCRFLIKNFCFIPKTSIETAKLDNPKICSTYLPYEDNGLIVFGGYNEKGTDRDVKLYNLETGTTETLYESNFNNSYGNYATILHKKGEKILINIQPVQFKKGEKYGVEMYDFKTKKLTMLKLPVEKRNKSNIPNYYMDLFSINILDTNKVESIDYQNYLFGLKDFMYDKTDKNTKVSDLYDSYLNEIYSYENPEIHELNTSFWQDNYPQKVISEKNNKNNLLKILMLRDVLYFKFILLPLAVRNAKITDSIQLNDNELLYFYEKNNSTYIVYLSNLGIDFEVKLIGKVMSKYKNKKYVQISDTLYQIGGIKAKKPFTCGDSIEDGMEISGEIREF